MTKDNTNLRTALHATQHLQDADCANTIGPDNVCTVCQVDHSGPPCPECNATAYHRHGCRWGAPVPYVPDHLRNGLEAYLVHGVLPGGFLTAVLRNDLTMAALQADAVSLVHLHNVVAWLVEHAPAAAWGNRERVGQWVATKRPPNTS